MKALLVALSMAAAPATAPSTNPNTNTNPNATPPGALQNAPQYDALPSQLPSMRPQTDDVFSVNRTVDKLHHVNEKNIEYGNLAKTRGGDDAIRKFGAKLVKDHQSLDTAVLSFAKANNITLGASQDPRSAEYGVMEGSTGSTGGEGTTYGTNSDSLAAAGGTDRRGTNGAMGAGGTDFDATGSVDRTGAYDRTGSSDRSGMTDSTGAYDRTGAQARSDGQPGKVSGGTPAMQGDQQAAKKLEMQAKLDELKNLQGAEFDSKFLSNVIDSAQRATEKLTLWKGNDKKLDVLIDRSLKMLSDHEKEARKLNSRIPAA